jgi:predicted nucleic acid-binding protein
MLCSIERRKPERLLPLCGRSKSPTVLLVAERRQRITAAQRMRALSALSRLSIVIDPETADRDWSATLALAATHGLTAYDATYLELSIRSRCPLATLDEPLRAAARNCGIGLLG